MSRILVVDQCVETCQLLSSFLEQVGHQVAVADNAGDALVKLRSGYRPAVILLDLKAPLLNGDQFLKIREKDPTLKSIPVLVTSGSAERKDVSASFRLTDCLARPIGILRLFDMIRNVASNDHCARTIGP